MENNRQPNPEETRSDVNVNAAIAYGRKQSGEKFDLSYLVDSYVDEKRTPSAGEMAAIGKIGDDLGVDVYSPAGAKAVRGYLRGISTPKEAPVSAKQKKVNKEMAALLSPMDYLLQGVDSAAELKSTKQYSTELEKQDKESGKNTSLFTTIDSVSENLLPNSKVLSILSNKDNFTVETINDVYSMLKDPSGEKRKFAESEIGHLSETVGRNVAFISKASLAIHPLLNKNNGALGYKERIYQSLEAVNHHGITADIFGSVASIGVSLSTGKNNEEKLQGAGLGLSEIILDSTLERIAPKIIRRFLPEAGIARSAAELVTKEGLGYLIGSAITPPISRGFAAIGRKVDAIGDDPFVHVGKDSTLFREKQENQQENQAEPLPEFVLPAIKTVETQSSSKTENRNYAYKGDTRVRDARRDSRDEENMMARRAVHGRAF